MRYGSIRTDRHMAYTDRYGAGVLDNPHIVGSCCIHLHTTANTIQQASNIFQETMLTVVAYICM